MPDPAAAAGGSTADSQDDLPASDAAPVGDALAVELKAAPHSPDLGSGTDISVDLDPQGAVPPTAPPASSDPDQMTEDATGLGGVAGEGGAG